MFREISAWHLALILIAFVVLFGYKKLPDATRSLGRSMRIFKSEVKGLHDDDGRDTRADSRSEARTDARVEAPRAVEPAPAAPRTDTADSRPESERA